MSKSLIKENRNLRNKVARLEAENQALRAECEASCHDDLVEQMRQRFDIPRWLLSERSYEILQGRDFRGIEEFMKQRAIMLRGNRPKIVDQGGAV